MTDLIAKPGTFAKPIKTLAFSTSTKAAKSNVIVQIYGRPRLEPKCSKSMNEIVEEFGSYQTNINVQLLLGIGTSILTIFTLGYFHGYM